MKAKKKTEAKGVTCGKEFQFCDQCEILKLDENGKWICSEGHKTFCFRKIKTQSKSEE